MRTLTLRRWLVLSLVSIFVIPFACFNITAVIVGGPGWWSSARQTASPQTLDRATAILGSDVQRWSDPAWRDMVGGQLSALQVGAELYDGQGNLLGTVGKVPATGQTGQYSSGHWWHAAATAVRVVQERGANGQPVGTINLYDDSSSAPEPFLAGVLAGFAGLLLALIGIGWLLGHYVVRPLESASRAAHQIAAGDLELLCPEVSRQRSRSGK